MPKKPRFKRESSVVRTEPDHRRATGRDDDDDFEIEETTALEPARKTSGISRYQRSKVTNSSLKTDAEDEPFPFMLLPAEIRNMIYRYLVVSKSPNPIRLDRARSFTPGGIEIAILLTNRQIHNEAVKILYEDNKCLAFYGRWETGVSIRKDDPKTKTATSRTLRSGRAVDMVKHKGLIYSKSLHRLRHVEFHIDIFDRSQMCDHMTVFFAQRVLYSVASLWNIAYTRIDKKFPKGSPRGFGWSIRVHSLGPMPLPVLKLMILPILQPEFVHAVRKSKLRIELEGKFAKNWEKIFHRISGCAGFVTGDANEAEIEPREVDPDYLEESFVGIQDAWEDPDSKYFFRF